MKATGTSKRGKRIALRRKRIPIHTHQKMTRKGKWDFSDKTGWDWIQLLLQLITAIAVPLSLIVGFIQFTAQQQHDTQQALEQQQHDTQQALEQQQQATLETYLDRMSELLLTGNLIASKPGDYVRSLARARTLTALQNLNVARKEILLKFLYQSNLIISPYSSISKNSADNPIIDLSGADLNGINLTGTNRFTEDLHGIDLHSTSLVKADLSFNDMRGADFSNADLDDAILGPCDLTGANLVKADLIDADLHGSTLTSVNLSGADLSDAIIEGSLFLDTNLSGTIMPDGSKHP